MKAVIYSSILFLTPFLTVSAQQSSGLAGGDSSGGQVGLYVNSIITFINDILFPLALALAFIFLVWGIVKYFVIGGDSDDGKTKGKDIIIYSLVGFVVIFSFYGLVNILTDGLGFGGENSELPGIPVVPVPPSTE